MLLNRELPAEGDAYAKLELVFPQLTQEMVDRSLPYGVVEQYSAGSTIYGRGSRGVDFLIVLRGSVLITGPSEQGVETVVTIHNEREFTGELDLFSYREALVTARAATETGLPSQTTIGLRWMAFTTPQPLSRHVSVPARKRSWWAAETQPAKPRCFSPALRNTYTF